VTLHAKFFGTVPNFQGLSAELSRLPNPVPNLSGFCVEMCCSWWFWRLCLSEILFSSKCTRSFSARAPSQTPLEGGVYDAPPDSLVRWEGGYTFPLPPPRRIQCLDLGVVAASKKCPKCIIDLWSPYSSIGRPSGCSCSCSCNCSCWNSSWFHFRQDMLIFLLILLFVSLTGYFVEMLVWGYVGCWSCWC